MSPASDVFSIEERKILEARARSVAPPPAAPAGESIELEDLVVVRSGADLYGLRASFVRAVAALTKLSPIPVSPPHVAGLTSFRGNVIVVFHLHAVVGAPPALSEYSRMLVLDDDCAIAVDAVERIEPLGDVLPPPEGLARAAGLVQSVTPSGVAVLDVPALLRSDRMEVDIAASDVGSFGRSP